MTPEILAYLKNEPSDYVPTKLATLVHHWRDRLQTEDARLALTDDLALEASTATDEQVDAAMTAWCAEARAAWFAFAGVADKVALQAAVADALAADHLTGWAGAHDALGACGRTSADFALGRDTCSSCYSAARLAVYDDVEGPPDAEGNPTVVKVAREHGPVVAALQASLRAVLVGLCS